MELFHFNKESSSDDPFSTEMTEMPTTASAYGRLSEETEKENEGRTQEATTDVYSTAGINAKSDFSKGKDIIQLNNVHKTYLLGLEGVPAVRGVTMTIKEGEFVCMFGTSGGGKTSLLNILGTIDKPTKGELILCGQRITNKTTDTILADLRLRRLGFVFQTFNLLSSLTALENVEMPMILAGALNAEERRARALRLLTRVGMAGRVDHLPSQLSGGEQQRVTIARALANDPSILLLDEPTGDLDSANGAIVMNMLLELHREGKTLIMVTHDISLKYHADRIIWVRDGKIVKVEVVSSEKKADMSEQLQRDLKDNSKEKKPFDAKANNTEVRKPNFYKTYVPKVKDIPLQSVVVE